MIKKKKFGAQVDRILHLVVNSLYFNSEIFIRELISNASDACNKLRYLAQSDNDIHTTDELKVVVSFDSKEGVVCIMDNGIGMDEGDLHGNLGTIASSSTLRYLESLKDKSNTNLIGQFGVGFYSVFMVSDDVSVITRKVNSQISYVWKSDGKGEYSVDVCKANFTRGTKVIVRLKSDYLYFAEGVKLREIIKKYSDHILIPIYVTDTNGKSDQVNLSSALWQQDKVNISKNEYSAFYKSISVDQNDPWLVIHNKNEGVIEFVNLLFIPHQKTVDLFHPNKKSKIKLYVKRVLVSDDNLEFVPKFLRFVIGIIDCEDIALNISRETLQYNSILTKIKSILLNKILLELKLKKKSNFESYLKFWDNFGSVLKEGLCDTVNDANKLFDICVFKSALFNKMITLDDYIHNVTGEDKVIYYLNGENVNSLKKSPQIEGFINKKIDVLLLVDTIDNFWVNINSTYKGYNLKSVTKVNVDLNLHNTGNVISKNDNSDISVVLKFFKNVLGILVKEVRISRKLISSPVCLVADENAMDIRMERFLVEQRQLSNISAKILELNLKHEIIQKFFDIYKSLSYTDEFKKSLVFLLYDQACILENEPVSDVFNFASRLNLLISKL